MNEGCGCCQMSGWVLSVSHKLSGTDLQAGQSRRILDWDCDHVQHRGCHTGLATWPADCCSLWSKKWRNWWWTWWVEKLMMWQWMCIYVMHRTLDVRMYFLDFELSDWQSYNWSLGTSLSASTDWIDGIEKSDIYCGHGSAISAYLSWAKEHIDSTHILPESGVVISSHLLNSCSFQSTQDDCRNCPPLQAWTAMASYRPPWYSWYQTQQ